MNELIAKRISQLNRFQSRYIYSRLNTIGLTDQQHIFLLEIDENPGISYGELAKIVYADKTSTTKMIDRLMQKNLIFLLTSETDKRRKELYLTYKGVQMLSDVKVILQEATMIYINNMNDDEARVSEILLNRMLESTKKLDNEDKINKS